MQDSKGFSLIEMLVVLSIMSVVAMAGADFMVAQTHRANQLEAKNSANALNASLSAILTNNETCTAAVTAIVQALDNTLDLTLSDGMFVATNTSLPAYGLNVKALITSNLVEVEPGIFFGKVQSQYGSIKEPTMHALAANSLGSIYFKVNLANEIVECGVTKPKVMIVPVVPVPEPKDDAKNILACQDMGGHWESHGCKLSDCGH